jgi:hypothetical protein
MPGSTELQVPTCSYPNDKDEKWKSFSNGLGYISDIQAFSKEK